MWYFFKQSIFLIGLMLFMVMTCVAILQITVPWVMLIVALLNLSLYATAVILIFYREGEKAWKLRQANDMERLRIVRTGMDIKINTTEEYSLWKGFIFGLASTVPLIIALIVHTFMGPDNLIVGQVSVMVYYVFYLPYYALRCCITPGFMPGFYDYYHILYVVVAMALFSALGYYLGARKLERAQEKVEQRKNEIESGLF